MKKPEVLLFILLMGVLILVEILCARLAYETLGEVASGVYAVAVGVNLIFILLAVRSRTAAALGAVALALLIVPYQVVLADRLVRVQVEAARIVAYVYEQRLKTGDYPTDLSDYIFDDSEMAPFIQEYQRDEARGGFRLAYRVGSEWTSHTYTPDDGWGYYPD